MIFINADHGLAVEAWISKDENLPLDFRSNFWLSFKLRYII
jgi:uncharacterized protein YidB (DUF937 family)